MKSKLVLNLRNCQYDLFKTIAIEELGWREIDKNCNVYDPMNAAEILKAKEDDDGSTGDNSSALQI